MILALFLLAASPVHAPPCWLVKTYVDLLGEKAARAKGKAHGYTDVEIDATRARCFGK